MEKMVMRDFVDLAQPPKELEQATYVRFCEVQRTGNIANPRRSKMLLARKNRRNPIPDPLVAGHKPHFVAHKPYPSAIQPDPCLVHELLEKRPKRRCRQARLEL